MATVRREASCATFDAVPALGQRRPCSPSVIAVGDGSVGRRSFDIVPHQERSPAYMIFWDRDTLVNDLRFSGVAEGERQARADRYFTNNRLLLDEDGAGFVDSLGQRHPIPATTARMVTVNLSGPVVGIPGYMVSNQTKLLLFFDRSGSVVQLLPNYGWNMDEVVAWAHEVGWDTEITIADFEGDRVAVDRAFPGIYSAPRAPAGLANRVPPPPLLTRLRRRLGR